MLEAGTLLVTTDDGGDVIGVVGLEAHGEQALLRSLAVESRWRGRGAGRALVDAALAAASTEEVWLLAETAEQFLAGCGFRCAGGGGRTGHRVVRVAPCLRGIGNSDHTATNLSTEVDSSLDE